MDFPFRVAYRRDTNLKDILTKAKLPQKYHTASATATAILTINPTRLGHLELKQDTDTEDKICVLCHALTTETNYNLSKSPSTRNRTRKIMSCKQSHNHFLLSCSICDSKEEIMGLNTAHSLTQSIRQGSMNTSHQHDIDMNKMSLSPIWSTTFYVITCTKCLYKLSGTSQRMKETITEEIVRLNLEFNKSLFSSPDKLAKYM